MGVLPCRDNTGVVPAFPVGLIADVSGGAKRLMNVTLHPHHWNIPCGDDTAFVVTTVVVAIVVKISLVVVGASG